MITLSCIQISEIIKSSTQIERDIFINQLIIDSRERISAPEKTIFFALKGKNYDAHQFLGEVYAKAVRVFVVSDDSFFVKAQISDCIVLKVDDTMHALHLLAAYVRAQFKGKLIAISGSNGKTSVKEWLYYLLHKEARVFRSPKSYNSQIGVALSLLLLDNRYDLAFVEAGISEVGEMGKLRQIIQPDFGIFTGIGTAHQENFSGLEQKIREKLILFQNSRQTIFQTAHFDSFSDDLYDEVRAQNPFTIGSASDDSVQILNRAVHAHGQSFIFSFQQKEFSIDLPFTDGASEANALTCVAAVCLLGFAHETVFERFASLPAVEMRLELKEGINGCRLINDSYNSDLKSLYIALELLSNQVNYSKKTIILSDILQSGIDNENLYKHIAEMLVSYKVSSIIGIGEAILAQRKMFVGFERAEFYATPEEFIENPDLSRFQNEAILIKGSRAYKFERISDFLQLKKHSTRLEINMQAMLHNLDYYRSLLSRETKLLVMVKAFSYGSGLDEIALFLEHHKVDCLGVAYIDEGVRLRNLGVSVPIMVMNPDTEYLPELFRYNLEPEIYSFGIFHRIMKEAAAMNVSSFKIHVKFDTGMSRLGFSGADISQLTDIITQNPGIHVQSVFTHLSGTDEAQFDDFTHLQVQRFLEFYEKFSIGISSRPDRHVLNSSGIERFPEYRFEMVRLGIGMYGFSPNNPEKLKNIATLKSNISQLKLIQQNETVGYSRKGMLQKNSMIAIIPMGYADGLNRALSNGVGQVFINGKVAHIIGNICMDMFMADVSEIEVKEGDEVIILGDNYTAKNMADVLQTIPYEIITGISQRVKRVYFF